MEKAFVAPTLKRLLLTIETTLLDCIRVKDAAGLDHFICGLIEHAEAAAREGREKKLELPRAKKAGV